MYRQTTIKMQCVYDKRVVTYKNSNHWLYSKYVEAS